MDAAENTTPLEPVANVVTKITKPQRESGLELLRIIAMLLILLRHVYAFCNVTLQTTRVRHFLAVCGGVGKLGVYVFILISAYFMVNKKFKFTRVLNTILQTTFYAVVIYCSFVIFGGMEFNLHDLFWNLFASFGGEYWFVTLYIMLLLASPALNLVLKTVNQKTLGWSIFGMVASTVLFPFISFIFFGEVLGGLFSNNFFIFLELYCVAGYIRLYGLNLKKRWIFLMLVVVLIFVTVVTGIVDFHWMIQNESFFNFSDIIGAIGLLLIFKDFKFKNRLINVVASTIFGIYLIHHHHLMRQWEYAFYCEKVFPWVNSATIVYFLLVVTVFTVCMLIDLIRQLTIHRATNRFLQYVDQKLEQRKQQNVEPPQSTEISND